MIYDIISKKNVFLTRLFIRVGIQMKSFGLWYQRKDNQTREISEEMDRQKEPQFSLHVNFWSLEDIKTTENLKNPILDIGIKIKNYEELKNLTFYCPFAIDKSLIYDLSNKLAKKNNASIIFNTDCEIQTKDSYTIVEIIEHEEQLLVFPLEQVIKDIYQIKRDLGRNQSGTQIVFSFESFYKYVQSVEKLKEMDTLYIRFRIKNVSLKDYIYFDSEPINKSFESAFSGTRIIDFKVNEKRNIDEDIRAEIIVNKQKWATFKDVHFLVMVPSSYDLTSFYKKTMTCRELEEDLWDDYLETSIDFSKGHVLAYHWRDKEEESKKCEDFACLVKVNYSRAEKSTIALYMLSVIALGILSSMFVTSLAVRFCALSKEYFAWGLGTVAFCFIIIFLSGKKSR